MTLASFPSGTNRDVHTARPQHAWDFGTTLETGKLAVVVRWPQDWGRFGFGKGETTSSLSSGCDILNLLQLLAFARTACGNLQDPHPSLPDTDGLERARVCCSCCLFSYYRVTSWRCETYRSASVDRRGNLVCRTMRMQISDGGNGAASLCTVPCRGQHCIAGNRRCAHQMISSNARGMGHLVYLPVLAVYQILLSTCIYTTLRT